MTPSSISQGFWLSVLRGACKRCPRCGQGRLFIRYLKPVAHCSICNEDLASIQPNDGPAWLTIIVVGHILAPLLLAIVPGSTWPDWMSMIVWPFAALALAGLILPHSKGIFIGFMWHSEHKPVSSDH